MPKGSILDTETDKQIDLTSVSSARSKYSTDSDDVLRISYSGKQSNGSTWELQLQEDGAYKVRIKDSPLIGDKNEVGTYRESGDLRASECGLDSIDAEDILENFDNIIEDEQYHVLEQLTADLVFDGEIYIGNRMN